MPAYSKTITALFYRSAEDKEPLWGWAARKEAISTIDQQPWQYQTRFKLHLADEGEYALAPLPPGKNPLDLIADYLRALSKYAFIKASGSFAHLGVLRLKDIKWYVKYSSFAYKMYS
jgi:hypothetical protein